MGNITHQPDQHPIDAFLDLHASEITEPYRAWIREAAVKAMQGADINLNHCPAHLRSELLDIIVTATEERQQGKMEAYLNSSKGKKFVTSKNTIWI